MECRTVIIDTFTDWAGVEMVVIDNGNNSYTSLTKATYDEQQAQAEHFTPMVTDASKS
jgi:hypothetical protein